MSSNDFQVIAQIRNSYTEFTKSLINILFTYLHLQEGLKNQKKASSFHLSSSMPIHDISRENHLSHKGINYHYYASCLKWLTRVLWFNYSLVSYPWIITGTNRITSVHRYKHTWNIPSHTISYQKYKTNTFTISTWKYEMNLNRCQLNWSFFFFHHNIEKVLNLADRNDKTRFLKLNQETDGSFLK